MKKAISAIVGIIIGVILIVTAYNNTSMEDGMMYFCVTAGLIIPIIGLIPALKKADEITTAFFNTMEYNEKYNTAVRKEKYTYYTEKEEKEYEVVGMYYHKTNLDFICDAYLIEEEAGTDRHAIGVYTKDNHILVGYISRDDKRDLLKRLDNEGIIDGYVDVETDDNGFAYGKFCCA